MKNVKIEIQIVSWNDKTKTALIKAYCPTLHKQYKSINEVQALNYNIHSLPGITTLDELFQFIESQIRNELEFIQKMKKNKFTIDQKDMYKVFERTL